MRIKKRSINLSSRFFLSLTLAVGLCFHPAINVAGYTVRDGGGVPVSGVPSQGTFLAFEENQTFWGAWSGDFGTESVRVSEPGSANGDGQSWRVTLTDAANGSQRFSLVGWALVGLNASGSTDLVFRVRGAAGFEPFEVGLKSTNGNSYRVRDAGSIDHPNIGDFIVGPGSTITTSYQEVRIPLTEFSSHGVNTASLDSFEIISVAPDGQNMTIYVDAMGFDG